MSSDRQPKYRQEIQQVSASLSPSAMFQVSRGVLVLAVLLASAL